METLKKAFFGTIGVGLGIVVTNRLVELLNSKNKNEEKKGDEESFWEDDELSGDTIK